MLASVARMYYVDELGQSEIAAIFGISRSTVSRLLSSARQQGIVRIWVDDFDPHDHDLERQLVETFGLRRSVVVRAQESSPEVTRRTVGYFSAPVVAKWLRGQKSIGVSGGRTVAQLIHFIQPQEHDADHSSDVDVVQLMGSIGSTPSSIESSELCRTLARRLHGSFHTINAPAFMDSQRNRDLLVSHAQIRAVWSMLPSLDMTVVGIGTLEESVFVERQVLGADDFELLRKQGAVGEICGRFFDVTGRECTTPFRDHVISVELDLLRSNTEVVAVTCGANRTEALTAAIRGGLVHSLVIDDTGAKALLSGS